VWIARAGSHWHDLLPELGKWNTIFKKYRDWVKSSLFEIIFAAIKIIWRWNVPWMMWDTILNVNQILRLFWPIN